MQFATEIFGDGDVCNNQNTGTIVVQCTVFTSLLEASHHPIFFDPFFRAIVTLLTSWLDNTPHHVRVILIVGEWEIGIDAHGDWNRTGFWNDQII